MPFQNYFKGLLRQRLQRLWQNVPRHENAVQRKDFCKHNECKHNELWKFSKRTVKTLFPIWESAQLQHVWSRQDLPCSSSSLSRNVPDFLPMKIEIQKIFKLFKYFCFIIRFYYWSWNSSIHQTRIRLMIYDAIGDWRGNKWRRQDWRIRF